MQCQLPKDNENAEQPLYIGTSRKPVLNRRQKQKQVGSLSKTNTELGERQYCKDQNSAMMQ